MRRIPGYAYLLVPAVALAPFYGALGHWVADQFAHLLPYLG